jgi:hypothetical protein
VRGIANKIDNLLERLDTSVFDKGRETVSLYIQLGMFLDEANALGLTLAAEVERDVQEHTTRRAAARIVPSEVEVVTEVEFLEVVSPVAIPPAAPPAL